MTISSKENSFPRIDFFYKNKMILTHHTLDFFPWNTKKKINLALPYRPISILKNLSKVFENNMHKKIATFIDKYFSIFLCGFGKGYSTQQCVITSIGKWKNAADSVKSFGALLTDLSKAFHCLPLPLLLAKLNTYDFSLSALRPTCSYPSNREQRAKTNAN